MLHSVAPIPFGSIIASVCHKLNDDEDIILDRLKNSSIIMGIVSVNPHHPLSVVAVFGRLRFGRSGRIEPS
jgi:hypothetical protein